LPRSLFAFIVVASANEREIEWKQEKNKTTILLRWSGVSFKAFL
jgi:hypothetical protein